MADETLEQPITDSEAINPPPPPPREIAVATPTPTGEAAALAALIATARQLPGLVPGLVHGTTAGEVEASLIEARAEYARIKAAIDKGAQEAIPATGGSAGAEPDVTPGYERIRRAVENEAKGRK